METLAIIAIVFICILIIGLQHLFNHWIRKGDDDLLLLGCIGILVSIFILGVTIFNAILIFGSTIK